MWPIIIIVFLVICYHCGKNSKSSNPKEKAQTKSERNIKNTEQSKKQQYDAETERLFKAAIDEMEKYAKFKASTKYAKNKLKTISKCGLRGYDARTKKMLLRSSIKVNKRYEKGIHETAETALKILEQKKQLDTESKGQFIRYYMTSPLRLKFITILQILERNAHWEPEVHFQTYTPPSYSSPSYSSPSYSSPSYSPPTHGYTQAASTAIRETDEIYKRFERRSEIQQLRRTGFAIDADELEASYKNKNLL